MSSKTHNTYKSDYAIESIALSKRYEIYKDPKDRLKQALMGRRRQYFREFWALKDVSFNIRKAKALELLEEMEVEKVPCCNYFAGH